MKKIAVIGSGFAGLASAVSKKIFSDGFQGIKQLPRSSRFGVYVAFVYYLALFRKIRNTSSELVLKGRIKIPNTHKATLLAYSFVKHQLNMI